MSRSRPRRRAALVFTVAAMVTIAGARAAETQTRGFGFGKPASASEIAGWDIDVRPDGSGLPPGSGSVEQGQVIYDEKCANCHGTFGESNSYLQLAGGVGSLGSQQPVRTTGSKLNHATTLWDYIRRAMPFTTPQTLSPDEVYALTAYVLNLNDIVPAGTVLDRDSLPKVRMPNRDGFTTAHGLMRLDGRPDTANVACMHDCAAPIRPTSEIPGYARDSHGDLSQQRREMGAIAGVQTAPAVTRTATPAVAVSVGLQLARKLGCSTCHNVDGALIGPSFRAVAARYAPPGAASRMAEAQGQLVVKVKNGGVGVWGTVPMPAQVQVSEADARRVVEWILGGAQ
jgi:S-disulfanyl-L-cysteine oxidoreductase SoxD